MFPACITENIKKTKKAGVAVVSSVNKSTVKGWVSFHKTEKRQVTIKAEITGLKPNQKYGFHIHQYGDCRDNGKNAGKHLGSYKKSAKHGAPDSKHKHIGDLGNLTAGKDGTAVYKKTLSMCMYKLGGRSVIIHANEDDLKSQPSGNAGPYIGCGVIGYVNKDLLKKECKKRIQAKKEKCEGKSKKKEKEQSKEETQNKKEQSKEKSKK